MTEEEAIGVYLEPTEFLDCDSAEVIAYARHACRGAVTACERATALYYAVRDGIRYNPYSFGPDRELYRAGRIASLDSAFCVQKSNLLCASARAMHIPARVGFADVRNHLASPRLLELMGTDLFVFHGYTELYLQGKWIKATPTFNRELCEKFGVLALEFDGTADALFHPFDSAGRKHMEYVRDHGHFAEFPYELLIAALAAAYPGMSNANASPEAADDPVFRP